MKPRNSSDWVFPVYADGPLLWKLLWFEDRVSPNYYGWRLDPRYSRSCPVFQLSALRSDCHSERCDRCSSWSDWRSRWQRPQTVWILCCPFGSQTGPNGWVSNWDCEDRDKFLWSSSWLGCWSSCKDHLCWKYSDKLTSCCSKELWIASKRSWILRRFIADLERRALRLNEINSVYDDLYDDVPHWSDQSESTYSPARNLDMLQLWSSQNLKHHLNMCPRWRAWMNRSLHLASYVENCDGIDVKSVH